jgi:hypothetical protein
LESGDWKKVFRRAQRELQNRSEPPLSRDELRWVREQGWEFALSDFAEGRPASTTMVADLTGMTVDHVLEARRVFGHSARPGEGKPLPPASEGPTVTVDGPDWWPLSVAQMFSKFQWLQVDSLRRLGCCDEHGVVGFLALRDVLPLVCSLAQSEQHIGDSTFLHVPHGEGAIDYGDPGYPGDDYGYGDTGQLLASTMRVFRGLYLEPLDRELRRARQQPLAQLADDAQMLARKTGCRPEEAVAFLLCDRIPSWVPWVVADYEDDGGLVIRVGIPEVTARDVSDAYREIKKLYFERDAGSRRGRLGDAYELVKFVGSRFPDGKVTKWAELHREFDALHPGAYASAATMQTTFSKYRPLLKYLA